MAPASTDLQVRCLLVASPSSLHRYVQILSGSDSKINEVSSKSPATKYAYLRKQEHGSLKSFGSISCGKSFRRRTRERSANTFSKVIKLMQSFKSKEYVRETFARMHFYWYLTNDGIEFLKTYLNLPSEIVPATLKKKHVARPMGGPDGDRPRGPPRFDGDRPIFGDRDRYRGGPRGPPGEFGDEKGGAPADYHPSFSGAGRRPAFGSGAGGLGGGPPAGGSGFACKVISLDMSHLLKSLKMHILCKQRQPFLSRSSQAYNNNKRDAINKTISPATTHQSQTLDVIKAIYPATLFSST